MEATKKLCIMCGNEFLDYSLNSFGKYCSIKCRNSNRNVSVLHEVYKCEFCGQDFNKKFSHQKYCSIECSRAQQKSRYSLDESKHPWYRNRFEVFKRDNFTCHYCGRNVEQDHIKLTIDHVQPKNYGGPESLDNLVTACSDCNLGKSDYCLDQAYKVSS